MSIIVLEGLPAGGKSIIANILSNTFEVIPEYVMNIGNNENSEEVYFKNDIEKLIKAKNYGKTCFIERGYPSTLAYNYSKLMVENCNNYYSILNLFSNNKVHDIIKPDLYIMLDISVETSLKRRV